ncbi:MAG: hypothetical protein IPP49_09505 [Saprospiraceae bacterium]|nr:hypothetical protein [Saprospiraceae bacterium]
MHTDNKKRELIQILSRIKGSIIYGQQPHVFIEIAQWPALRRISCANDHGGMEKVQEKINRYG